MNRIDKESVLIITNLYRTLCNCGLLKSAELSVLDLIYYWNERGL